MGPTATAAALRQELLSGSFTPPPISLLEASAIGGAMAGYTSRWLDGRERIVINPGWLQTASPAQLQAVLLEELGHAIDHRLNGSRENDQRWISVNGTSVLMEAAAANDASQPTVGRSFRDRRGP